MLAFAAASVFAAQLDVIEWVDGSPTHHVFVLDGPATFTVPGTNAKEYVVTFEQVSPDAVGVSYTGIRPKHRYRDLGGVHYAKQLGGVPWGTSAMFSVPSGDPTTPFRDSGLEIAYTP